MTTLTETTESETAVLASPRDGGHRFTLLVHGGTDAVTKVLVTLRARRYTVRSLQVDLTGDTGRIDGSVEPDGRDPELLLAQLRRVVAVVRAEHG
ncbi:ACT domain-containing protein [Pseudonocardia nematodicida]|uniref:ACT domain-containing protein n=1 Tax=Pseudonocardia nematodicida TaxID=1206997 RepID=A0ABV1KF16_9PSEU